MLSSRLLEILREWWRLEKPRLWLFPGRIPGCHIAKDAVESACQQAHQLSGISKPITPHSMSYVLSFNYVLSFVLFIGFLIYFPSCSAQLR